MLATLNCAIRVWYANSITVLVHHQAAATAGTPLQLYCRTGKHCLHIVRRISVSSHCSSYIGKLMYFIVPVY